jgi:argininosuccinate lyase
MQNAAETGFMNAFAAATYLVNRDVPFRLAHEQIGKAVQLCLDRGCELQELSLEELRRLNPAFDQDFYECLKVESVLAIHDVLGGTAPSRVQQALRQVREKLRSNLEEVHAHA